LLDFYQIHGWKEKPLSNRTKFLMQDLIKMRDKGESFIMNMWCMLVWIYAVLCFCGIYIF
jgi:hypothetical protein